MNRVDEDGIWKLILCLVIMVGWENEDGDGGGGGGDGDEMMMVLL